MSDIADQQEINRLNALVETLVRERDEARAERDALLNEFEAEKALSDKEFFALNNQLSDYTKRAEAAEAEAARLREVLGDAVKWMNGCVVSGDYPAWHKKASAALEEAKHD